MLERRYHSKMVVDVTISVMIAAQPDQVFDWLTDLGRAQLWNMGLAAVNRHERMHEGMVYTTQSVVMGRTVEASIAVTRLIHNEEFELVNNTGAVAYRAVYRLVPEGDKTEVILWCQVEPHSRVFQLARPLVEQLAKARLEGDLQGLKALIESEAGTRDAN